MWIDVPIQRHAGFHPGSLPFTGGLPFRSHSEMGTRLYADADADSGEDTQPWPLKKQSETGRYALSPSQTMDNFSIMSTLGILKENLFEQIGPPQASFDPPKIQFSLQNIPLDPVACGPESCCSLFHR